MATRKGSGSNAGEAPDPGRERTGEAQHDARAAFEDGLDEAHRYLKRQWRDRPVAVTATVLGVGLLLGVLIGSRR